MTARRILGAYNRAVLEASQRTVLRTYAMASEKPAPKPGLTFFSLPEPERYGQVGGVLPP